MSPFAQSAPRVKCSLQWVIGLIHHHWALIKTPLGYHFPSHGDAPVIVLQDQSLNVLQQITDGVDVGVGQPKAQDVGLRGS